MPKSAVTFKVCVPDPIDYNDEYFGYSLKLADTKDADGSRTLIKYEGRIWANKGRHANEKYPILVNILYHKPIEATVCTPKGKYEVRFDRGGVFTDIAETLQSMMNKIRRNVEEICAAYEEGQLHNPLISANGIWEAEITCPFCGGMPTENPKGDGSICEECKRRIIFGWPEMWGIEFTPSKEGP